MNRNNIELEKVINVCFCFGIIANVRHSKRIRTIVRWQEFHKTFYESKFTNFLHAYDEAKFALVNKKFEIQAVQARWNDVCVCVFFFYIGLRMNAVHFRVGNMNETNTAFIYILF